MPEPIAVVFIPAKYTDTNKNKKKGKRKKDVPTSVS